MNLPDEKKQPYQNIAKLDQQRYQKEKRYFEENFPQSKTIKRNLRKQT